jgi:hypothetical protein
VSYDKIEYQEHLADLEASRLAFETAEHTLEATRILRDRAIMRASRAGMTRREVAVLSGVTPGRIQQIVGGAPDPASLASVFQQAVAAALSRATE